MDYKKLGLRVGLEIHQQISGKKLFCNCSADMKEEKLVTTFQRKIRPVAGEMGEVDVATAYEGLRDRTFIYHVYENEACLIDEDEEPPRDVNQKALETALAVAMILKLEIPDELHVMRKNVSDGSACSSYQRTIIVGLETPRSFIQTSQGLVKVTTLCLEEDACKIIKTIGNKVYYSLSRQGIPLLEIRTDPDIKTPEQAKETAQKIGSILRSFPAVRRGIGTIRQDVNLSIKGGARIEIKGFQDLRTMPKIIEGEVKRQLNLIKSGRKVIEEVRKALPDGKTAFMRPMPGAARLYPDTDCSPIKIDPKLLTKIRKTLPESWEEKIKRFVKKYKINQEQAKQLIYSGKAELFENLASVAEPKLVIRTLLSTLKELKRKEKIPIENLTEEKLIEIFNLLKGKATKEALLDVLKQSALHPEQKIRDLIKKLRIKALSTDELRKIIKDVVEKNKEVLEKPTCEKIFMGLVMKEVKGRAEGKLVIEILRKEIEKYKQN